MDKKYDIIYADPPWDYGCGNDGKIGVARDYFPCMSMMKLKAMPIADLCAKNCLLFLWVVNPELKAGIELGEAWGFKYVTVGFVWEKPNKVLCGNYTMSSTEQCLLFRKLNGKIPQPRGTRNERQFLSLRSSNLRCRKPDEIRDKITRMFPTQLKLELFATQNIKGWDAFGNEVERSIKLDD